MLRAWIAIQCDGCFTHFPRSTSGDIQPADAVLETRRMLRAEAKKLGWQRYGCKDFCPKCEIKNRAKALAEGGN
jgi:hypothetical protein